MREIEEIQANIEKFVANKNGGEHDDVWDSLIEGCRYEILYNLTDKLDVDRLIEICEAECEGRCVVLPCKVGDKVFITNLLKYGKQYYFKNYYFNFNGEIIMNIYDRFEKENYPIKLNDFGKTVFLTREEAEKARAENGGKQ